MVPLAAPLFADRFVVSAKNVFEVHPVKSIVTFADPVDAGGMSPTRTGIGVATTGVQAAPEVCCTVKLVIWVFRAAPGPLLPTVTVHPLAFCGPVLAVMFPPNAVALAKAAVNVAVPLIGAVIVCEIAPPSLHRTQLYVVPLVCGDIVVIVCMLPGANWNVCGAVKKFAPPSPEIMSFGVAFRSAVVSSVTSTAAAPTLMVFEVPVIDDVTVSVAVIVWLPVVFRVAENVPVPLDSVEFAGSTACASVLVKCTVPA